MQYIDLVCGPDSAKCFAYVRFSLPEDAQRANEIGELTIATHKVKISLLTGNVS